MGLPKLGLQHVEDLSTDAGVADKFPGLVSMCLSGMQHSRLNDGDKMPWLKRRHSLDISFWQVQYTVEKLDPFQLSVAWNVRDLTSTARLHGLRSATVLRVPKHLTYRGLLRPV